MYHLLKTPFLPLLIMYRMSVLIFKYAERILNSLSPRDWYIAEIVHYFLKFFCLEDLCVKITV